MTGSKFIESSVEKTATLLERSVVVLPDGAQVPGVLFSMLLELDRHMPKLSKLKDSDIEVVVDEPQTSTTRKRKPKNGKGFHAKHAWDPRFTWEHLSEEARNDVRRVKAILKSDDKLLHATQQEVLKAMKATGHRQGMTSDKFSKVIGWIIAHSPKLYHGPRCRLAACGRGEE